MCGFNSVLQYSQFKEQGKATKTMARSTHRKDSGWGWIVVCVSFFINFMMVGVRYSIVLLCIELMDHVDANARAVVLVDGIMSGLLLIAAPVSGSLVNKFGCRVITIVGSCLVFLGFLASAFATRMEYLYVTMGVVGGLGFSMWFMTSYIATLQWFYRYRSLAIGLAVSGSSLGGFAFDPVTNFLIETYTWRGACLILSAILLHGCVCGTMMIPFRVAGSQKSDKNNRSDLQELEAMLPTQTADLKEDTSVHDVNTDDLAELERDANTAVLKQNVSTAKLTGLKQSDNKPELSGQDVKKDEVTELESDALDTAVTSELQHKGRFSDVASFLLKIFRFDLLASKLFLLFAVVEVCINISYTVPFTYALCMADVRFDHVSRNDLVWLSNAMSIADVASRVSVGVLADWKIISNVKLMGILCLVTGFAAFIMPFCGSYWLLLTASVVYSANIVSAMVLIPIVLSELFGDDVITNSFGLSLFFGGISGLFGTPLAGWFTDLTGSYELTLTIAGVEFGVGGLLLFLISFLHSKHV